MQNHQTGKLSRRYYGRLLKNKPLLGICFQSCPQSQFFILIHQYHTLSVISHCGPLRMWVHTLLADHTSSFVSNFLWAISCEIIEFFFIGLNLKPLYLKGTLGSWITNNTGLDPGQIWWVRIQHQALNHSTQRVLEGGEEWI